jgi:hypothetical protein
MLLRVAYRMFKNKVEDSEHKNVDAKFKKVKSSLANLFNKSIGNKPQLLQTIRDDLDELEMETNKLIYKYKLINLSSEKSTIEDFIDEDFS